jgi:hypothetical protein
MLGFVRPFGRHAEVVGLFLGELSQLHADAVEVHAGDFVEMFRQAIDAESVRASVLPQVQLREALVGEAVALHEARMAGGAAEIHEAAFGEQIKGAAVWPSLENLSPILNSLAVGVSRLGKSSDRNVHSTPGIIGRK